MLNGVLSAKTSPSSEVINKMTESTNAVHSRRVHRIRVIRQGLWSVSRELLGFPKALSEGGLSVSMMRKGERGGSRGSIWRCCGCWPKVAQKIVGAAEDRNETENGNQSDRDTGRG